ARGERQGRARVGRAPRLLDPQPPEPAAEVRWGEREVLALGAVGEGRRVHAHITPDRGTGAARHGSADDEHVARDHRPGVENRVAVDDQQRAVHAARHHHGAVPHGDVAAPLVPARQARATHRPGRRGRVVAAHRFLRDGVGQLGRRHRDPRALGLDHDSGVLRGGDGAAERTENHEYERAHSGHPGWGACHPATLRGGSRPSRRMRRYRFARSVASLRAASATLPRAADRARAMSVRSKSSGRSRSGEMWIGRTLRRNNRSSRNWPCIEAFARSLLVAAITRTSTVTGFSPPSRSITPDSSTRSSFAWASGPRSPTSSRNSVPRSASSNRPTRRSVAPVNAPRSWPNISDSTRSFGMAALFTHTKGFVARPLWRWMAEATSSFPVPDSPVISTRTSVGATRAISRRSSSIAVLTPTSGSAWPRASCRRRFSASVRDSSSAARSVVSRPSGVS